MNNPQLGEKVGVFVIRSYLSHLFYCIYTSCSIKALLHLYVEGEVQNLNLHPNCINHAQLHWISAFIKADGIPSLG